jgi:hypothetical protein
MGREKEDERKRKAKEAKEFAKNDKRESDKRRTGKRVLRRPKGQPP